MSPALLELRDVRVDRAGVRAVDGVTLSVEPGSVVGLLGANGAGKSSLLRAVMGLEPLAGGEVVLDGRDLSGQRTRERARGGIGFCPEGRRLFPGLTVTETLAVAFSGAGAERDGRVAAMFERFPALGEKRDDRAWSLSGGQQQMLAIARALMNRPRLVLLDEPTLGLAPMIITEVLETVRTIADEGAAVLIAEQNVVPALRVADTISILVRGAQARTGPAGTLDPEAAARLMLGTEADAG